MRASTDKKLGELKSDLVGHETEHESIINELLREMDALKNGFDEKLRSIAEMLAKNAVSHVCTDSYEKNVAILAKLLTFDKVHVCGDDRVSRSFRRHGRRETGV